MARAFPDGRTSGYVKVITRLDGQVVRSARAEVRDLAFEDGYAFFLLYDSDLGCYLYLVAYDGWAFGGLDMVSYLWMPDGPLPGEQEIRALFDSRWRMDDALRPAYRGNYVFHFDWGV